MLKSKNNIILLIGILAVLGLVLGLPRQETLKLEHPATKAGDRPVLLGELNFKNRYPLGVLASGDKLYVTFYDEENVGIYSLKGKKIKEFAAKVKGQKGYPLNMAVLNDKLVITDSVNGAIGFYTLDGKPVDGFWTTSDQKPIKPVGVAVYKNVFYVTDNGFKGFMAIKKDGEILNVVKPDKSEAMMYYPWGIAVTRDGRALITDFKGSRVKAYNCAGWYYHDFDPGKENEIVKSPEGIAIDDLDRVHVVDKVSNRIFVFDYYGKFQFTYGKDLNGPTGITVDGNNRVIYIANTENNSLSVWGY